MPDPSPRRHLTLLALCVAGALLLGAAQELPQLVSGQGQTASVSVAVQQEIAALLSQVLKIEQEIVALGGTPVTIPASLAPTAPSTTPTTVSCTIAANLSPGSSGSDVVCLQQLLISQNLLPQGDDTGYFGSLTEAAVEQFQTLHDIVSVGSPVTTGYGAVGPKTRATLTALVLPASTVSTIITASSATQAVAPIVFGGGGGGGGGASSPAPATPVSVVTPTAPIDPAACGALGDGATDDSAAIAACAQTAAAEALPLVLSKHYRISSSITLSTSTSITFALGGELLPDASTTVTIQGPITAADTQQIFGGNGTVLTPNAPRVSVAWWGALANAADANPGIRAAVGSNRVIYFPPGTYVCDVDAANHNNRTSIFYPVLGPYCVLFDHVNNVEIDGAGATFVTNSQLNGLVFNHISNLKILGLSLGAPPSDALSTSTNGEVGFLFLNVSDLTVQNVTWSGDWGGKRTVRGIAGDWITNAVFTDLSMPEMSHCFDLAFLHNVTIENMAAVGTDDGGTGVSPTGCIAIGQDQVFERDYPAEDTFDTTEGVTLGPNLDISNFSSAIFLRAGSDYAITGDDLHDNPGSSVGVLPYRGGTGVYLYYDYDNVNPPCCRSTGDPVRDVSITGNTISNNGASLPGAGILIDASASPGEKMSDISITNNIFDNNSSEGVLTSFGGIGKIQNVTVTGNTFSGSSQTTPLYPGLQNIAGANIGNNTIGGTTDVSGLLGAWKSAQDATLSSVTAPFVVTEGVAASGHGFEQIIAVPAHTTWSFAFDAQPQTAATLRGLRVELMDADDQTDTVTRPVCYFLGQGSVDTSAVNGPDVTLGPVSVAPVKSGVYRCSVTATFASAPKLLEISVLFLRSSDGATNYTGNGASGFTISSPSLTYQSSNVAVVKESSQLASALVAVVDWFDAIVSAFKVLLYSHTVL